MTIATEIEKLPYASLSLTKLFLTVFNKVKNNDVILFMLPSLIVYFAAHLLFWPGQMSSDSQAQWYLLFSPVPIPSGHPHLSTLWLLSGKLIGNSPAFTVMINYTLFSIFTGLILNILTKKYGVNKRACYFFSFVFPLIPVNFLLLTVLWKDIPYSIGFVILLYGSLKLLDSEEKSKAKALIAIFFGLFLIFFMRFNGIIVTAGTVVFFMMLKPIYKKPLFYICFVFVAILLFFRLDKVPEKYSAMHASHYLGYLLHNDVSLEENDLLFLNKIMPLGDWKKKYSPLGVGSLAHLGYFKNPDALTKGSLSEMNSMGRKYLIKYPFYFLHYKYQSQMEPLIFPRPSIISTVMTFEAMNSYVNRENAVLRVLDHMNMRSNLNLYFQPLYWFLLVVFLYMFQKLYFTWFGRFHKVSIIKMSSPRNNYRNMGQNLLTERNFLFLLTPPAMNIASLIVLNTDYCYRYYYPTFVVSCFILLLLLGRTKTQKSDS